MTTAPAPLPAPAPAARPSGAGSLAWIVLGVAAVVALAAFPHFMKKPYVLGMGVLLFLAIIQGQAWNIIGGYAGQYSVGHAAFFGIGAYALTMLLEFNKVAPWWGIWAAIAAAMLLSVVVGSITLRLRGPYFVLASIAVAEIIRLATLYFHQFTRGAEGFLLPDIPPLHLFGSEILFITKRPFYFLGLGLAVLSVLVSWAVKRSKLGYYLQAIREDQDAAHSLGINLAFYKNVALAISAALTAIAGAFYALYVKFIDPGSFGLDISVDMVLICILGGIGTIPGPVIGAAVLVPLSEILRNPRGLEQIGVLSTDSSIIAFIEAHGLSNAHMLMRGILLVVLILFAPEGVLGVLRRAAAAVRRRARAGDKAPSAG